MTQSPIRPALAVALAHTDGFAVVYWVLDGREQSDTGAEMDFLDERIASWIIVGLLGIVVWFLRREINNNDRAHRDLNNKIDTLLKGDVPWIRMLLNIQDSVHRKDTN